MEQSCGWGGSREGREGLGDCGTPRVHFRAQSALTHMISYEEASAARVRKMLGKVGLSPLLALFEKNEICPEYIPGTETVCRVGLSLGGC